MKYKLFSLFIGLSVVLAPSQGLANNGYTSAANVYTGSSSRGWYGGGVSYVLNEWRKEGDVSEAKDVVLEKVESVAKPTSEVELSTKAEPSIPAPASE